MFIRSVIQLGFSRDESMFNLTGIVLSSNHFFFFFLLRNSFSRNIYSSFIIFFVFLLLWLCDILSIFSNLYKTYNKVCRSVSK